MDKFHSTAKDLSKNPLGIIALFIVLVYGFACLLFNFTSSSLSETERAPIIYFVVLFPILVLGLFAWLVSKHHNKLYAPQDFRDDESFLKANQTNIENSIDKAAVDENVMKSIMESGSEFSIVKTQEEIIEKDLTSRNIPFESDTEKLLIHSLAVSQVHSWFEKTYNNIFGSQIRLLKVLSENKGGLVVKKVREFYDKAKEAGAPSLETWTLEQYLSFLRNSGLINQIDDNFQISERGRDFLSLISAFNYSSERAL